MFWLCGSLASLDVHLPRHGRRGEDLGLSTGQGTLTALWTGEGGGEEWEEGEKGGRRGREMGGWEEAETCFFSFSQ